MFFCSIPTAPDRWTVGTSGHFLPVPSSGSLDRSGPRRIGNHDIPSRQPTRFDDGRAALERSEEHTSELQSLMRLSYAVFCLNKNNIKNIQTQYTSISPRT